MKKFVQWSFPSLLDEIIVLGLIAFSLLAGALFFFGNVVYCFNVLPGTCFLIRQRHIGQWRPPVANGGTALAQAQTAARTSHCIEAHMFSLRNHTKLFSKTDFSRPITIKFIKISFMYHFTHCLNPQCWHRRPNHCFRRQTRPLRGSSRQRTAPLLPSLQLWAWWWVLEC